MTNLTNKGATQTTAGKFGKAYSFNGTNGVCLQHVFAQEINNTQFSFAFWIKLNSSWSGWGQVLTIGTVGTSWNDIRAGIDIEANRVPHFSISDGTNTTSYSGPSNTALTTGVWYHIACSVDNKVMKMYINGAPATAAFGYTASFNPNFSNATVISIGGNSSEVGECDMTDVRIYDHALS